MPYDIVDKDTKPYIKVSNIKRFPTKTFAPDEISEMVLPHPLVWVLKLLVDS